MLTAVAMWMWASRSFVLTDPCPQLLILTTITVINFLDPTFTTMADMDVDTPAPAPVASRSGKAKSKAKDDGKARFEVKKVCD